MIGDLVEFCVPSIILLTHESFVYFVRTGTCIHVPFVIYVHVVAEFF